jgi:pimeloyl-ACP methyl ester carboxylesterase
VAIFVLVHGGFAGGWMWRNVAEPLRSRGHRVYAPTLTGLGEREHLGRPDTDLDTHIRDVVNVLRFEDLTGVILAGHSYGGMVITGVADQVPEALDYAVYVDAAAPADGESRLGFAPEVLAAQNELARLHGDGWRVPPSDLAWLDIDDPAAVAWIGPKMVAQPLQTLIQGIHLSRLPLVPPRRTYLYATAGNTPRTEFRDRARDWGWDVVEVATGHCGLRSLA